MGIEPMVGRIAGNDTYLCAVRDRVANRKTETALGLNEVVRCVMQVREMSEFQSRLHKKQKGHPKAASLDEHPDGCKKVSGSKVRREPS
jgi:hypothetical protein